MEGYYFFDFEEDKGFMLLGTIFRYSITDQVVVLAHCSMLRSKFCYPADLLSGQTFTGTL